RYRQGNILHDTLVKESAARLRYTVPDSVLDEELESWEPTEEHPEGRVRDLIVGMHPGVASGLTTIEKIHENYNGLSTEQFALEYLGLFGIEGDAGGIFDLAKWTAAGSGAALPAPPERFALAMVAHP